jgi:hypothetical protein
LISFSIQSRQGRGRGKDAFEFNIQQEQKTNAGKRLIILFTTITIKETGQDSPLASLQAACGLKFLLLRALLERTKKETS